MTTKIPPDVASGPLVMQKEGVIPSQPGGNPDQRSVVGEGRVDPLQSLRTARRRPRPPQTTALARVT